MFGQPNPASDEFFRELLASREQPAWGSNLPSNPRPVSAVPHLNRQTDTQLIPTTWQGFGMGKPVPTGGRGFTPQQMEMLRPQPKQPDPNEEMLIRAIMNMKAGQ